MGFIFKSYIFIANSLRKMILRFANSIVNSTLNTYHITINFQTAEKIPSKFRLEVLAELRDDMECNYLIQQLTQQIGKSFHGVKYYEKEVTTVADKYSIEKRFKSNLYNHISMKFLFRTNVNNGFGKVVLVQDETNFVKGVKDYRVNILKTGQISLNSIEDMFCIELITDDLK